MKENFSFVYDQKTSAFLVHAEAQRSRRVHGNSQRLCASA